MQACRLGRIGLWEHRLRYGNPADAERAVRLAEELGYGTVWVPDVGGDLYEALERLLGATERLVVATGILNIWLRDPAEVAARRDGWPESWRDRFLAGLGVSHALLVDATEPGRYGQPLARMREYLDALDAASPPLPASERVLAALGPRMLDLARDRAAGAHPYNVTPEHTAAAREILGAGPILAPEQAVVLEPDRTEARRLGRAHLAIYLGLPNYTNNLRRFGFGDEDFTDGGSDRLVDALVARGTAEQVAARVRDHLDAGADHVCLQVLSADPAAVAERAWGELAETFELPAG